MMFRSTAITVPGRSGGLRRFALAGILAAGFMALSALHPATVSVATNIAVLVNDEPITEYDISQRTRLLQATGGGGREAALNELIDERLKLQAARRLSVSVSESEVERAFSNIASRVNLSSSQFVQAMTSQLGVSPETLKQRLRADLAWRDVVRNQLRQEIQVRERDVESALAARGADATSTSIELIVRQVLFVVPEGSSAEYVRQRERDAEFFRRQFTGCETARDIANNYRDTVVNQETRRNTAELPPDLRDQMSSLQPGQSTTPRRADRAVEVIAVCERREVQDTSMARAELQDSMINEQGERLARRLLIDLKQAAVIDYR